MTPQAEAAHTALWDAIMAQGHRRTPPEAITPDIEALWDQVSAEGLAAARQAYRNVGQGGVAQVAADAMQAEFWRLSTREGSYRPDTPTVAAKEAPMWMAAAQAMLAEAAKLKRAA